MASEKVPMLAEGHRTMSDEVRRLKMIERPAVIEAIELARAHGDLRENADYHAAKDHQGHMEARIRQLAAMLENAEIVEGTDGDVVEPPPLVGDQAGADLDDDAPRMAQRRGEVLRSVHVKRGSMSTGGCSAVCCAFTCW